MNPILEPVIPGAQRLIGPMMSDHGCRPSRELGDLDGCFAVLGMGEIMRNGAEWDPDLDIGMGALVEVLKEFVFGRMHEDSPKFAGTEAMWRLALDASPFRALLSVGR